MNFDDVVKEFNSVDGSTYKSPIKLIADPSFSRIFKKLFQPGNPINRISGEDRIMSLINSVLYPGVGIDGYKVKKITTVMNDIKDINQPLEPLNVGALRFEIICRCQCWKGYKNENTIDTFDIIIQMFHVFADMDGLVKYFSLLKSKRIPCNFEFDDNIPLKVLSFLTHNNMDKIPHFISETCYKHLLLNDSHERILNIRNTIDIYAIFLPNELEKCQKNKPIIIDGKELDNIGKEWIKTLSLRLWASAVALDENVYKYIIPKNINYYSVVVQSIFDILEGIDFDFIKKCIEEEKTANQFVCNKIEEFLKNEKAF